MNFALPDRVYNIMTGLSCLGYFVFLVPTAAGFVIASLIFAVTAMSLYIFKQEIMLRYLTRFTVLLQAALILAYLFVRTCLW